MKTFLPNAKLQESELKLIKDIMTNNRKLSKTLQQYWLDTGKTKAKNLRFKDLIDMIKHLVVKTGNKTSTSQARIRAILGFILGQIAKLTQDGMLEEGTGLRYYTDEELDMIQKSEVTFRWLLNL